MGRLLGDFLLVITILLALKMDGSPPHLFHPGQQNLQRRHLDLKILWMMRYCLAYILYSPTLCYLLNKLQVSLFTFYWECISNIKVQYQGIMFLAHSSS